MAANQLASVFVKIGAETREFEKGLEDTKRKMGGLEKGGAALGTALKAGIGIGVAAIGGLVAGISSAVKVAGDLEQQAANISAVFGNMAPPVEQVKGLINDLALDEKLVVGINEAGAGIEMLAKNGLTYDQIAQGAARSTVLLANATGADLSTAADIATNAMSIFGLGVGDLNEVVATFVNAANKSQFGVEDWGYALANVGPKAATFGFALDDLFAAMTLTSGSFASGMQMGTSWAWMINGLVPNTNKAEDAMKELGLITKEGANQFFNADGTGKSLKEVLGLLQGAFNGLSKEQQMSYSRTIFGQEAFGALSSVLSMNNEQLNQLIPQMTDFSAVEAGAEIRTNTFQGAMSALQDTILSVATMIGDKFLPVLTPLIREFATFVKTYAPPLIDFFGTLAERLGQGIDKSVEWGQRVLPPLWEKLQQVGSVVQLLAGQIQQALRPVTDAITKYASWKDVLAALGILLLGPVVAALAAVVAAIGAVLLPVAKITLAIVALRTAWEKDFLGIRTITLEVLDQIAGWIKKYTGLWQGSWSKTLTYMLNNGNEVWREIVHHVKTWWGEMTNEIRHRLSVLQDNIETWVGVVRTKFKVWKNNTLGDFREWRDGVLGYFEPIIEWWDKHIQPFAQKGRQVIQGLWDGIREKWNSLRDWFTGVWGDLTDRFKRFFGIASPSKLFEGYGQNMMQGLELGIKDGITYVKQTLEDGSQVWEDVVTKSWVPVFSKAGQQISGALDATIPKLENYQKKLLDAKIAALELASKPILPDWATGEQPVLVHPPAVNTGDGGSSGGGPVTSAPVNNKYYKSLGSSLDALFGDIGVNVASKINTFAYLAKQAITAPGQAQWQGSSASYMGYNVIDEANVSEAGTGAVIGAIQALINELRNRSIKIDTAQMEALIDALKSGNPNAYSDLVGFMAGGR